MTAASYGVWWALASAMFSAMYMIPWKLSVARGPVGISVLSMIVSAALANTLLSLRLRQGDKGRAGQPSLTPTTALWGPRKQWQMAAVLSGLTLLGNTLSGIGADAISAPVLSVVLRTEVLWIALLSLAWLGERVTRQFWLGAAVAGAGLVVLQGGFGSSPGELVGGGELGVAGQVDGLGVAYGVGAALVFSIMVVLTRRFIRNIDPIELNGKRLWLAVALGLLWQAPGIALADVQVGQVGYGALAGLFGPFAARLCVMFAVRHVQASTAAICVQLAPLFTALFAVPVFGTVPEPHQALGGGLMLFGVVLGVLPAQRIAGWFRGRG